MTIGFVGNFYPNVNTGQRTLYGYLYSESCGGCSNVFDNKMESFDKNSYTNLWLQSNEIPEHSTIKNANELKIQIENSHHQMAE